MNDSRTKRKLTRNRIELCYLIVCDSSFGDKLFRRQVGCWHYMSIIWKLTSVDLYREVGAAECYKYSFFKKHFTSPLLLSYSILILKNKYRRNCLFSVIHWINHNINRCYSTLRRFSVLSWLSFGLHPSCKIPVNLTLEKHHARVSPLLKLIPSVKPSSFRLSWHTVQTNENVFYLVSSASCVAYHFTGNSSQRKCGLILNGFDNTRQNWWLSRLKCWVTFCEASTDYFINLIYWLIPSNRCCTISTQTSNAQRNVGGSNMKSTSLHPETKSQSNSAALGLVFVWQIVKFSL